MFLLTKVPFILILFVALGLSVTLTLLIIRRKTRLLLKFFLTAILALCISSVILLGYLCHQGYDRGMAYSDWPKLSTAQLFDLINITPEMDTLPKNPKGRMVILYHFGCPDCKPIYKAFKNKKDTQNKDFIYIPVKSPDGQKIAKQGKIKYIPTAVYFRKTAPDQDKSDLVFNYAVLYKYEDDRPVFNQEAYQVLKDLQTQGA